jgi:IS30 family transposase
MARQHRHFSLEGRCEITRLQAEGRSLRQIAAALDRSPSSLSCEMKRNTGSKVGYRPAFATEQARARRWKGSKLDRKPELRAAVLQGLAQRCSPEQVAWPSRPVTR